MTDIKQESIIKRMIRVGGTMGAIIAICIALIFTVSNFTKDKILEAEERALNKKFDNLFAPGTYDNSPSKECFLVDNLGNSPKQVFVVRKANNIIGYIVNYDIIGGYSSPFSMIAGVNTNGEITYIDVTVFNETPGLGDKILRSKGNYLDSYKGASLENRTFEVKKYGGNFDYFTGATVTPRAVARSTESMLKRFKDFDITAFPVCDKKE